MWREDSNQRQLRPHKNGPAVTAQPDEDTQPTRAPRAHPATARKTVASKEPKYMYLWTPPSEIGFKGLALDKSVIEQLNSVVGRFVLEAHTRKTVHKTVNGVL